MMIKITFMPGRRPANLIKVKNKYAGWLSIGHVKSIEESLMTIIKFHREQNEKAR